jgi:hypothetical protein
MNRAFSGQGNPVRDLLLSFALQSGDLNPTPETQAVEASAIPPPAAKPELTLAGSP